MRARQCVVATAGGFPTMLQKPGECQSLKKRNANWGWRYGGGRHAWQTMCVGMRTARNAGIGR